jgi:hypothetical protein
MRHRAPMVPMQTRWCPVRRHDQWRCFGPRVPWGPGSDLVVHNPGLSLPGSTSLGDEVSAPRSLDVVDPGGVEQRAILA